MERAIRHRIKHFGEKEATMATVPIANNELGDRLGYLTAQVTSLKQALASAVGGVLPTGGGTPFFAMTPA